MGNLELAGCIRKGLALKGVRESMADYVTEVEDSVYRACALGCALIGHLGSAKDAEDAYHQKVRGRTLVADFAKLLGIPTSIAHRIEVNHLNHVKASDIASLLEKDKSWAF